MKWLSPLALAAAFAGIVYTEVLDLGDVKQFDPKIVRPPKGYDPLKHSADMKHSLRSQKASNPTLSGSTQPTGKAASALSWERTSRPRSMASSKVAGQLTTNATKKSSRFSKMAQSRWTSVSTAGSLLLPRRPLPR